MKKLFALLMLVLIGLPAARAAEFVAGTTYYIDGSESNANLFTAGAVIKVLTGSQEVSCTDIGNHRLSFQPSQNCSTISIKRYNPDLSTVWNHIDNIEPPADPEKWIYKVNGNLNSGGWVAYNQEENTDPNPSEPADAWLISKNINGWIKADKSQTMAYDAPTDIYTITIDASKLKASLEKDNGFKIGYGSAATDSGWNNVVGSSDGSELKNGVSHSATLGGSNNFYVPTAASGNITIKYNHANKTLIATWDENGGGGGGDNPSGEWTKTTVTASGSLPRMYLTVPEEVMSRNLKDKNYRKGFYYMVDKDGNPLVGSEDTPDTLQIKARGNFTRTGFSKKPFKLKLNSKQSLLGLSKSKHYALLTHADDEKGYLCNFIGFWLGKQIFPDGSKEGQDKVFTPQEKPIELYINGYYWGLYFLTESIRVEKTRINIAELDDNVSDPKLISGGYVVELDNYPDEGQITMTEAGKSDLLRITPDTPEVYSDLQKKFITEQFSTMNKLVGSKSDDLWKYMDLDMAARYYVVMEILGHWEAYHGSTYLYRDRGADKKWIFSPLWDCGHALELETGWLYDHAQYGNTWIKLMLANEKFSDKVKETYRWFWANKATELYNDMETYVKYIEAAAKCDHERWGSEPLPTKYNDPLNQNYPTNPTPVYNNSDLVSKFASTYKPNLEKRIVWLNQQWGESTTACAEPEWDDTPAADLPFYTSADYAPWLISKNINNWELNDKTAKFEYVEKQKAYVATVDADMLRTTGEGNGFKIGFYTADATSADATIQWTDVFGTSESSPLELENGAAATIVKGGSTKNFTIPDDATGDVTIAFDMANGKITASWIVPKAYCYFNNTNNWDEVYVWAYDSADNQYANATALPGEKLTETKDGYLYWEASKAGMPTSIIFSSTTKCGSDLKAGTGVLTFVDGGVYDPSGIEGDARHLYTLTFIDRHSQKWQEVRAYVSCTENSVEYLGAFPGDLMTKRLNAPARLRADEASEPDNIWTYSFNAVHPADQIKVKYSGDDAAAPSGELTVGTNTAHLRTDDGFEDNIVISALQSVGAEGFSVSVMNGMLVINSRVALTLPVVGMEGRVMMIAITPGITMIGLDHGVYIVNGKKYTL